MEIKIGDYILTTTRMVVKITGQNKEGLYGVNAHGHLYPTCSWVEKIEDPAEYLMKHHYYDQVISLLQSNAWPEIKSAIDNKYLVRENQNCKAWKTYTVQERRTA